MSKQNNAPVAEEAAKDYYYLYQYLHDHFNLILHDSEIQGIVDAVNKWQAAQLHPVFVKMIWNNDEPVEDKKVKM